MADEIKKHYRVTIEVQEVTPAQPETIRQGARVLGPIERRVHEVARLSIAADTEHEAYAKTMRMLGTLAPERSSPAGYVETDR